LKNLYGDAGFLELTNIDGTGGARVTIGIPFHHE
jgi:hypothetical protein